MQLLLDENGRCDVVLQSNSIAFWKTLDQQKLVAAKPRNGYELTPVYVLSHLLCSIEKKKKPSAAG